MAASSAKAVARLAEQTFADHEQAIAALEAALAAERPRRAGSRTDNWRRLRSTLLLRLAERYCDWTEGDRADNLEKALAACQRALELIAKESSLALWAQIHHRIGGVYLSRLEGDRAQNLEWAIVAYEAALTVRTRKGFPSDFAKTQNNLAIAYRHRVRGESAENLERAIAAYAAALTVDTRKDFPAAWAKTHNNLGLAYRHRLRGERADNLERAIGHFNSAMTVLSRESFPEDWAMTQNNLASTYADRIHGDRADNLEQAIAAYEAALAIRTRDAHPTEWARTQSNLAIAYTHRIRGLRADNLERAIAACEMALSGWTRETVPAEWAQAQNNLAIAYRRRIHGERADNLERAIAAYEAALVVHRRDSFPEDWAQTQSNLAIAYRHRIRGGRADNLERSIGYHQAALTVYTRNEFPVEWARTQNNLGAALVDRSAGEQGDNIERAIAAYEAALRVRTPDVLPTDWAQTQHNLGIAYARRIHSERIGNLARAAAAYEAASTIRTREAHPRAHLETTVGLGQTYLARHKFPEAANAFSEARETFLRLFQQGLDETETRGVIEVAGSLFTCAAYVAVELGNPAQAFRLACEGRARVLATALHMETLDLAPEERQHLEAVRAGIRAQLRLLERAIGVERHDVLERLKQLRAELSATVTTAEEGSIESNPLAQATALVAEGCVIVVPIVTEVGGKLLVVRAARDHDNLVITAIDLPELTSRRLRTVVRGSTGASHDWRAAFANDLPWRQRKERSARAVEEISHELGQILGGPLERALKDLGIPPGTRLIYMPSGALGLLPLGLAEGSATGQPLLETYEIVATPSISALTRPARKLEPSGECSLAAIINPTGDLIFAPIEGALVAAHFEPQTRTILDQTSATPESVLDALKGKTHWHFSTHGLFDLEEAQRSALVMKDGATLSVSSLLSADGVGRPRLVALSACETGLHEVDRTPEEFIGLTGAFMTIGARAVLATLWPVDDRATAFLVAKFYDHHLDGGLAPAAALREAQLWLRSAPRDELIRYALAAARQIHLSAYEARKLVRVLTRAMGEAVRFFDIAGQGQDASCDAIPLASETPDPPFAHPVYWGGFVVTGL